MDTNVVSWVCEGELQCWGAAGSPPPSDSRDLYSPISHRLDSRYSLLIPCHPCSSALLGVLWEEAEALMPCQPWREQLR